MYTNPMNSPMPSSSTLPFSPVMQHQAVATLLLIENSQAISFIWADLRDRYLPSLVTKLESADPAVSNKTMVLESLPLQNRDFPPIPRQYDTAYNGLCAMQFNYDPGNRLSLGKIRNGVDFLASTNFQGYPAVRHLVIVAASTPQDDAIGVNPHLNDERSPWQSLAHNLAQAAIQCHVVLAVNEDMGPLMLLFEETLRLQNLVEETPSFPVNNILFRLSARSKHNLYSVPGPYPMHPTQQSVLPRRHRTFPSDSYLPASMKDDDSSYDAPLDNPPSLVSQLQQVHGLTKKKVYGTKAARPSFFREERVRDRYRKGTTPLSGPAATGQPPSVPNGGGRGVPRSRAERSVRGSPTETHSRHPSMNRRMSAPDADTLVSPTSFGRPSSLSSPISPTPVSDIHVPATQLTTLRPSETDVISDPTWLRQHATVVSPLPPNQISGNYREGRWHGDHNLNGVYPQHSTTAESPAFTLSTSPKQRRQEPATAKPEVAPTSRPARNSRSIHPEDEEPFIFNDEYVAQTVALFENEVLPAYPNFAAMGEPLPQPATPPLMSSLTPPRHSFTIAPDHDSLPPSPSYVLREPYAPVHQSEVGQPPLSMNYIMADSPLAFATTYSPGSNSSLTGWAG